MEMNQTYQLYQHFCNRLNQTRHYNIAVLAFLKSRVMTQNQPTGMGLRKPNS